MHNVDHVQEPDELRATARQGQGDTSIRNGPVSVQKDVRTAHIGKTAHDEVDHQDPARVPASRVPHLLP